jgi:hypothetical protein
MVLSKVMIVYALGEWCTIAMSMIIIVYVC